MAGALLRDDLRAGLSELYRAAVHAAATHHGAAEQLPRDARITMRLLERARACERVAGRARDELEALGDRPSEPDADRDDLGAVLREVVAAVSRRGDRVHVEAAADAEAELSRAASAVADVDGALHEGTRAWLRETGSAAGDEAEALRAAVSSSGAAASPE